MRDLSRVVSVVIPAHNAANTISETLSSLRSESDLLAEVLVVDDASTDSTALVAAKVGKELSLPLRTIRVELRDPGMSRNVGIAESSAPWLYFIDADDQHVPGGLRCMLGEASLRPGTGLVAGSFLRSVDGRDRRLKRPGTFSQATVANSHLYIAGRIRSFAMGSVLVSTRNWLNEVSGQYRL